MLHFFEFYSLKRHKAYPNTLILVEILGIEPGPCCYSIASISVVSFNTFFPLFVNIAWVNQVGCG